MIRAALVAALILSAAVAQVTWAANLGLAGAFPNFVLLAIVALAWVQDVRRAMAWACAGGLLLDFMSPGPIGPHALALVSVAYLTGFWSRNLERQGGVYIALSAAAGTVVYSLLLVALNLALRLPVPAFPALGWLTLAAAAYNGVLMPLAAGLVRLLHAGGGAPQPT